jgi:pumilio family protein 6
MAASTKASSSKRKGDSTSEKSSRKKKKTEGNEKQSSTSQKRALKHERQSTRRHAEVVNEAKEIWNKLRLKNNTPEEVRKLTTDLMALIRGKMKEIVLQHDASRVVQAAIQFGTDEQRKEVVLELCAQKDLLELSKVQYAHFAVLKMIKYCYRDADCVKAIVKVRPSENWHLGGLLSLSSYTIIGRHSGAQFPSSLCMRSVHEW